MSWPAPYVSGHKEWKTLAGLERAVTKLGGKMLGFKDDGLHIDWPPRGVQVYPVSGNGHGTQIELQLAYDLSL